MRGKRIMLCFEVQSKHEDGYEDSILFECDEAKYAYLEAVSHARYYAYKYGAIVDVNAFIMGDYKNTHHCVFSCGLFGPIHWNAPTEYELANDVKLAR